MNHEQYTTAVDEGNYPGDSTVPLPAPFVNTSGQIQNLLLKPMQSVAAITSKKGAVRANHYHKTDWHYAYVAQGRVLYFERPIGSKEIPKPKAYVAGDVFFTPPMVEHAMLFTHASLIVTMAKNVRSHEEHEADVVRVDFVTEDVAREFMLQ